MARSYPERRGRRLSQLGRSAPSEARALRYLA